MVIKDAPVLQSFVKCLINAIFHILQPGDIVTCEIEGIGSITNPVVAEESS